MKQHNCVNMAPYQTTTGAYEVRCNAALYDQYEPEAKTPDVQAVQHWDTNRHWILLYNTQIVWNIK